MEPINNSQQENNKVFNVTKLISLPQRCLGLYGDVPVLVSIRTPDKVHISNIVDFAHVAVGGNNFDTGEPELDTSIVLKNSFAPLNSEGDDIRFCVEIRKFNEENYNKSHEENNEDN